MFAAIGEAHVDTKNPTAEQLIKDEFRTMVIEMPLGKVTVSDLCARVGISRKTFYKYFVDKEDILAAIIYDDLLEPAVQMLSYFGTSNPEVSVPLINEHGYQALLDRKDFYTRVVTQNQERIFVRAMQRCLTKCHSGINDSNNGHQDNEYEYASQFLAAGQAAIFVKWIRSGMDIPPAQMAAWFSAWADAAVHVVAGA